MPHLFKYSHIDPSPRSLSDLFLRELPPGAALSEEVNKAVSYRYRRPVY